MNRQPEQQDAGDSRSGVKRPENHDPARQAPIPADSLLYGLDDRPPWPQTLLYGLQWLMVLLPALTLISFLAADVLELPPSTRLVFFQRLLILTGAVTVIQTLWGHQLPLLDGPAMALVLTLAPLASAGLPAISGGMIFGGLLLLLCGLFGLLRFIIPLFTDRVVGVVLLLIGLTMLPHVMPMLLGVDPSHPHGRPMILGLAMGLTLLMAAMSHYLTGFFRSLAVFWGLILGTVVFAALGLTDFSSVPSTPWLTVPQGLQGFRPRFDPAAALSFTLAYLAVLVNTVGSLYSVEPMVRPTRMGRRLNRALVWTGLSGMAAGLGGVVGTVPYGGSPGVIVVTRVGSRFALTACGVLLLAMALFGKLNAVFTGIPDAVVAAALLAAVAAQIGVGINLIQRQPTGASGREYLIVGLPILLGSIAGLLPEDFLNQWPSFLRPLLGNGLIVGVVLVLTLEHVLLREKDRKA